MLRSFVLSLVFSLIATSFALPSSTLTRRARCFWPQGSIFHECEPLFEDQVWSGITFGAWRYVEVDANTIYAHFLDGHPLEVKAYLVPHIENFEGHIEPDGSSSTHSFTACHMSLSMSRAAGSPEGYFKNTVAHEMYHCVQQLLQPKPENSQGSSWWREATAVFMSNILYPANGAWKGHMQFYNPQFSISDPANRYADGIFFQHLYNTGWSPRRIHDWVMTQTWTPSPEAELARLAADPDLTDAWPGFASKFVDQAIKFADGHPVTTTHKVVPEFVATPGGSTSTKKINVAPFQINAYETRFAADEGVTMTWTPEEPGDTKTVLQYRQGTSGRWATAAPGNPIDLQNTATSACPSGSSTSWYFIITSTNDPARNAVTRDGKSHGTLAFTVRTSQRKRQDCPQLDSCLVGDWTLDNNAMAAFLSQHVAGTAGAEGVILSSLAVTGVASFSVSDTFLSNSVFQAFTIGYDVVGISLPFHTDIVIDGTASGLIVPGTNTSTFTWTQNVVTTGGVRTNTVIPSTGLEIPWDASLDGSYGPDTVVQYSCSGENLEMAGYTDGVYAWAYTWKRAAS